MTSQLLWLCQGFLYRRKLLNFLILIDTYTYVMLFCRCHTNNEMQVPDRCYLSLSNEKSIVVPSPTPLPLCAPGCKWQPIYLTADTSLIMSNLCSVIILFCRGCFLILNSTLLLENIIENVSIGWWLWCHGGPGSKIFVLLNT